MFHKVPVCGKIEKSEGRQRRYQQDSSDRRISEVVHQVTRTEKQHGPVGRHTARIAGSSGTPRGGGSTFFAASSTLRSFTSEPRNTMYSNTLSEGGTSSFPRRPSVPNERTTQTLTCR